VFSCRKDRDIVTTTENEYPVEQYVNTSLKGKVVTDRDVPVDNATVTIGEYTRKTDFNGIFYFKNIKANEAGSTITVTKNGYTDAKKIFYPQLNATSYIKIELHAARKTAIINTSDKDKIVGDEINEIQITGNGFIKSGNPYQGNISIEWEYIAGDDKPEKQYGDPVGFDKYRKLAGLNSYGILGFKVLDETRNQIEISEDNSFELKLGIGETVGAMNDEIRLWRYSTKRAKWLEIGKATLLEKDGKRYYFAEVKKSGYYNFAKPFKIQKTEIVLNSQESTLPYINANIETGTGNNYRLNLTSNNKGIIPCFIPLDEKSKIIISYGESKIEKEIDGEINKVKLDNNFNLYTFTGDFYTCDANPISNGYISLFTGENSIFYFIDESGFQSKPIVLEGDNKQVSWIATDLESEINTGKHTSILDDNRVFDANEVYLCQEPFARMQYGDETVLMDLTIVDPDIFGLTFENGNALYEINSSPFKGVGEYNLDSCHCTPTIKNSDGERLFIYANLENKISIIEYKKPGMVRGGLDAKVRTGYAGTDTTDLKIYYSIFYE